MAVPWKERGRSLVLRGRRDVFFRRAWPSPILITSTNHELVANGVGAVSALSSAIRSDLGDLPPLRGKSIVLVTGTSMRPHLASLAGEIADSTGASLATVAASNSIYGPMVTTAGLLAGADHALALGPFRDFDLALFSRSALNDQDLFLDDLSLSDLRQGLPELRICPSEHVTDTLLAL